MSLSEAFESLSGPPEQCKTCKWYAELDPGDQTFFDRKVTDPKLNQSTLRKACELNGLVVAPSSFRNHLQHHDRVARTTSVLSEELIFG